MDKLKFTLAQNTKYILSHILGIFQIFTKKNSRKNGISVMIRVRDEEDWIARSLLSINDFADEVVIVNNNSTDRTLDEIERIKEKLNYQLIIENEASNDIIKVSNHALSLTSFRWIFRWDSDFIAHTSGKFNIINLRKLLLDLPQSKHYLIYPLTVSFAGDLFHVKVGKEIHSEGYIHTWHPKLRYIKKGKFEVLKTPFFYTIKRINKIYFVHIGSAKPIAKIIFRLFWLDWQFHLNEFPDITQFISYKADHDLDSMTLKEIAVDKLKRLILPVRKYRVNEFGEYPDLMKKDIEKPRFKMIYKNGEPYTRTDFID